MTNEAVEKFLLAHPTVDVDGVFKPGREIGDWRVTALIGKGGNGEVYRVEHRTLGFAAALKVLIRESARSHFMQEAHLLSGLRSGYFPKFYACGEEEGHPYYVIELLEPGALPTDDAAVASYILTVAKAVGELHWRDLVHRDIKPQNILFRGDQPVVIDLGLVERIGTPISKASGTPRYAAPEQMSGGAVSPAIDIHALGILCNQCFGGKPPLDWERIINRSTSSLPARRFKDIEAFISAVRRRHRTAWLRRFRMAVFGLLAFAGCGWLWWNGGGREAYSWRSLCTSIVTNEVTEVEMWRKVETNDLGIAVAKERAYKLVTNEVQATLIRLGGFRYTYNQPMKLADGRYIIEGPGVLNAPVSGSSNVVVRLSKCIFNNRTELDGEWNQINYVVDKGVYLNFPRLRKDERISRRVNVLDGYGVYVRFQGPEDVRELYDQIDAEWRGTFDESSRKK